MRRLALAGLVLLAACGTANVAVRGDADFGAIRKVAVSGFSDYPRRPGSGEILAGAFEQSLLVAGYELVERTQVDKLLRERKLPAGDPRAGKELKRLLGVDALLLGRITDFREPREQLTQTDVVDEHQDPIYVRRVRDGVEETTITGYKTTRVVRREPRTVQIDGLLGVSARLVRADDGAVLWSGSDVSRAYTFEDSARFVADSILKAVKRTWPVELDKKAAKAGR